MHPRTPCRSDPVQPISAVTPKANEIMSTPRNRRQDNDSDAATPQAVRQPETKTVHGIVLTDDYAWLRADNWREVLRDPAALPKDIRTYLEAENAYAAAIMAETDDLQRHLVAEMRGRIKE